MDIRVENVRKTFQSTEGAVTALNGVSLVVPSQTVTTLLGPSGCGKTTLLRCIAGLETPDSGTIAIGDTVVWSNANNRTTFVTPDKRGIGMVFQTYAIWPHMTVFDNVAYPLEAQGVPRSEIPAKVARALEFVQLAGYERRPATALSGGQQQRVSLARAIVSEPQVILFDEPLSNLDAKLREETRADLRKLLTQLGITALYVTHDRFEALALSDDVVVMHGGEIVQRGTPEEVYFRSHSRFVVDFIGKANFLDATVAATVDGEESSAVGQTDMVVGRGDADADMVQSTAGARASGAAADGFTLVQSSVGPLMCVRRDDVTPGQTGTVSIRMEFVHVLAAQGVGAGGDGIDASAGGAGAGANGDGTGGEVAAASVLSTAAQRPTNRVEGTVATVLFLGEYREVEVLVGDVTVMLRAPSTSTLQPGDNVQLFLEPTGCRFLPEE